MEDLSQLNKKSDKRTETLTKIGEDLYSNLKGNEITIDEAKRVLGYVGLKLDNEVLTYLGNRFVQELK